MLARSNVQINSGSSLADYLRYFLSFYVEKRLSENTFLGYRVNIEKHIIPALGGVALDELTPEMIDFLYDSLSEKGLSSTSVLYVHSTLRKALNTAKKRRILRDNVLDCVDPPRRERFSGSTLTPDEVSRLLSVCQYRDIYVPVLLGVMFGLRRGEVLGLGWGDVDFENHLIQISHSASFTRGGMKISGVKTESSHRVLLMPSSVSDALNWWRSVQTKPSEHNLVVSRFDGSCLNSNRLHQRFKNVLRETGLPDIRFHDLRHTYATLMLRNNIPAKIVCEILGHSSIDVTLDVYSHVLTEMQRPAADVVDGILCRI